VSTDQQVADLARPLADDAGLDLVAVDVRGSGPRQLVKVVVDRKGGVDLATCQRLSERLSARLDEVDVIDARYALEVTSPGVDWPLRDQRDFDRVEGRTVLVHRRADADTLTEVRGTVLAAEDDAVLLDVDGNRLRVPYAEVAKATQTLPW
jgi:ribosome maturation factor RimP